MSLCHQHRTLELLVLMNSLVVLCEDAELWTISSCNLEAYVIWLSRWQSSVLIHYSSSLETILFYQSVGYKTMSKFIRANI